MKRRFTKILAAVALLVFMMPSMVGWGQTTETITYTFTDKDWKATDNDNATANWTNYTSGDSFESASPARGIAKSKATINGTSPVVVNDITSVTVVASANQAGPTLTIYKVVDNTETSIYSASMTKDNNKEYTVNLTGVNVFSGKIKVVLASSSSYKSVWIKSVSVSHTTGGGSTDPSITISGDEISNNAVSFDWNSFTNGVEYTASVVYNNMETPSESDAVVGVYTDATCQTAVSGEYFDADFGNDTETIEYAFYEDNPNVEPRTVYMRVEVLGDEDYIPCNVIAVTQAGKPQYTVTYNANGATAGTAPTDSNSPYVINSIVTVLGNTGTLVKTGYTWNGWNTQADGSGTSYAAGAHFTITANTTLYAQWILNKHSYTLNVTGTEHLEETVGIYVNNQTGWASGDQIEYGQQVTVSVIPVSGYVYTTTVTYGDNVNVPVEQDMFTMPDADVTISVVVEKLDNVTFDFSQIPGFSDWGNGYSSHTVDYQAATVIFEAASKQTQNITDIPVTKGQPVSIVMNDGMPNIKGVTFVCRQWTNKTQTITLHYSTDGGESYTSTEITSNNFTISCAALPTGTNAVKITFSSQSNQVGIESATLNFSTDPVIAVNPTSLTGFAYSEGHGPSTSQTFTVSGNYLTSNITLAATNFEMSTDETNWSNSLPLVPTNGTVANTTVYVRLKSGLAENSYNENLSVRSGDLSETVSLSGTVNPAPVLYTYTQATSIVSGKRYIIVNNEASKAMGAQNSNNRAAADVTIQNQTITVSSEDGIFEFVINGPEIMTKGESQVEVYTIYDVNNSGYLYAAGSGSGSNYLRNQSFNDDNGKWTIQIDSDGEATIKAQGTNSRNWMRYNSQSNCFSCYSSGQDGIYLYVKDDTNYEFYKDIAKYTTPQENQPANGWNLIASPVASVTPSAENGLLADTYDLYYFDQTGGNNNKEWKNYKTNNFSLVGGHGYLYANSDDVTLKFTGTPNTSGEVPLTYSTTANENMRGWNLVGNPFGRVAYLSGRNFYRMNDAGTEIVVSTTTSVNPMEGIFVKAADANDNSITFSTTAPEGAASNENQNVVLDVIRNRGTVIDRAIVSFNDGAQLPKLTINENSTKLYIPQDDEDYAIVRSEAQGELPVSFRASENGTYTLSMNVENVDMNYLHLIDNMTGMDIDLLQTPSYTFEANTNDYANRFKLVFAANGTDEADESSFAFFSNGNLIVNNEGNATLQVIDINGRILSSETISGSCSKAINATTGVYMLRLINGDNVKVQKVVVR